MVLHITNDCGMDCFCLLSYSVFVSVDVQTRTGVSVASKWLVILLDYSLVGCSCAKITERMCYYRIQVQHSC